MLLKSLFFALNLVIFLRERARSKWANLGVYESVIQQIHCEESEAIMVLFKRGEITEQKDHVKENTRTENMLIQVFARVSKLCFRTLL